jgi:hypothetical protein
MDSRCVLCVLPIVVVNEPILINFNIRELRRIVEQLKFVFRLDNLNDRFA